MWRLEDSSNCIQWFVRGIDLSTSEDSGVGSVQVEVTMNGDKVANEYRVPTFLCKFYISNHKLQTAGPAQASQATPALENGVGRNICER